MNKNLLMILICLIIYLMYLALFSNKKSLCEPLINLNLYDESQYITWSDNDMNYYVMVPLSLAFLPQYLVIKLLDKLYENKLYQNIIYQPQSNDKLKELIKLLKEGYDIKLEREPILLIRVTDIVKLNSKILTGELRKINDTKTIIVPYVSHFRTISEANDKILITNKLDRHKINLDKLLLNDYNTDITTDFSIYREMFKSLLLKDDDIEYYLITNDKQGNDINNMVKMF